MSEGLLKAGDEKNWGLGYIVHFISSFNNP